MSIDHLGGFIPEGDRATWMPDIWGYLALTYGIKSVIDIGAGYGHNIRWWHDLGFDARGVEGHPVALQESPCKEILVSHDYERGPYVPEREYDLSEICQQLRGRYEEGRDNAIIILAEGAGNAQSIADTIKDAIGFETRVTVLGHYQRGGAPSVFDRLLASRFGKSAVELLLQGERGVMVGLACNAMITTPLETVIRGSKRPQDEMVRLAEELGI